MFEYTAVNEQTINPGEYAVFTATVGPSTSDLVQHFDGTSGFLLSGCENDGSEYCCPCQRTNSVFYTLIFGGNIAVASTGTAGEISVAFAIEGVTDPASTMQVTPAAVSEYFNVSRAKSIPIFRNCCQTVAIRNTSDQPITMQNASLILLPPGSLTIY